MPVLRFKTYRLLSLINPRLGLEELASLLESVKAEVEDVNEEYVEIELEVDRPDMYIAEGVARYLRGVLGLERGSPRYGLVDSGYTIIVEDVKTRPYIGGLVAWGVNVDEDYLEELIQLQEKLHNSLGGRRRRVAIGIHDLDKLPSKTLRYSFKDIDEVYFTPLGHTRRMSLREVLAATEQGVKYGSISLSGERHPVLYSGDEVISVPPVINAELTRVEPGTRNIFVDVTGTDWRGVLDTLAVLAASLADRGDGRIGLVSVEARDWARKTPDMEPRAMELRVSEASRLLGVELGVEEVVDALERARMDAVHRGGDAVMVSVPRYRVDVLHWVDLAEEVMIVRGIGRVPLRKPRLLMRPAELPQRTWERVARDILAGYGFVELLTFTLVKCSLAERVYGARPVALENPISEEHACIRPSLLPSLLEAVARADRPGVRVFEVGEVYPPPDARLERHLAILLMDEKAGYEDIQSYVYGLLELLGDSIESVKPCRHPALIEGRTACIETRQGIRGVLGEVKPSLLAELGATYPVAAAELDYTGLQPRR